MNMPSKSFVVIVFTAVVFFSVYQYNQIVIHRNYIVLTHTDCDPLTESCFVLDCDTDEMDCDKEIYKKVKKNASYIDDCTSGHFCPKLSCGQFEKDCSITLCSEENKEPGETCSWQEMPKSISIEATSTDQLDDGLESINQ